MSERFDAQDVVAWTDAKLVGDAKSVRFRSVSIDTRTVEAGALFVAIRGDVHDAHAYVEQALDKGAAGLLVEDGRVDAALARRAPIFEVQATTPALGQLAAGHRRRFDGPLVAVTGSNGKTTTKELIHSVLSSRGPCLKTLGNLNNEFGLPLSLLAREADHWAGVVEIGMNHRGEIAPLAEIAAPTIAVITNVGTAHIEHLGSREEIAAEKGDLLTGLDANGVAVLNADDERVMSQATRAPGRVLRFGREAGADVSASDVRFETGGAFAFTLHTPSGDAPVRVAGL
ncbi:MAG: UDP-N-acetylmuramoyl-tripeptide--D-alanyl-D-alanine ligase, partial [Actinomycetota bacterium]|nr:UDP-N-acetylmuramoyl-tripeptide--D-alanyl-D-alanine ligase [Actinomycetota bacterium]